MMFHARNQRSLGAGLIALAVGISACEERASTEPEGNVHTHAAQAVTARGGNAGRDLVKQVHSAIARYHSTVQAEKAGYERDDFCVEAPGLGGMGHHWVNPGLVDPVFEPTRPEVILYAPDKHGKMKLVAVEYIVIDAGQPAPTFDGQPFAVGGTPVPAPHWSLHVWLVKDNPSGLFAPFNPTVDCP